MTQFTVAAARFATISTDANSTNHRPASVRQRQRPIARRGDRFELACSVLDDAFARVPDYAAVLVTGDLVQDDTSGYLRFRSIFGNLKKPVLCIPGNHDEPEAMRRELARRAVSDLRHARDRRLAIRHARQLRSRSCRRTPDEERARAARRGARRVRPSTPWCACIIIRSRWAAAGWTASVSPNAEDFWRIIDAHAHVRAVVWGHVHQALRRRARRRAPVCDAVDRRAIPAEERSLRGRLAPAGLPALSTCTADGRIDSEVRWVESLRLRQAAAR